MGYGPNGKLIRKTLSAKTRTEAAKKLKFQQRHLIDRIPLPDATLTVSRHFISWCEDVLRRQVIPGASSNHGRIFDHHIIPTLGRKTVANLSAADVDRLTSPRVHCRFN